MGNGRAASALAPVGATDVVHGRYWRTVDRGWADGPSRWGGRNPAAARTSDREPERDRRVTCADSRPSSRIERHRTLVVQRWSTPPGSQVYAHYASETEQRYAGLGLLGTRAICCGRLVRRLETATVPITAPAVGNHERCRCCRRRRAARGRPPRLPPIAATPSEGFPPRGDSHSRSG
jgi:hypothetical protein